MLRCSAIFILFINKVIGELKGHMKPLGHQQYSIGHVDILTEVPHGKIFYHHYLGNSTPALFKNSAVHMPVYDEWTDNHLKRKFGHLLVDVIEQKVDKTTSKRQYPFKEFLKTYQTDGVGIIMAQRIRGELMDGIRLLPCLLCGGYLNVIQEAYLWMTGKNTKTMLQRHQYDSFVCLVSGTKQYYMAEPKYADHIKLDGPSGKFPSSMVDVDGVDLGDYPGLANVPWWQANMTAGDCLFIPANWFHQASSYTEDKRFLEFNVLMYHLVEPNMTECENHVVHDRNALISLNGINLNENNTEGVRFALMLDLVHHQKIKREDLFKEANEPLIHIPDSPDKFRFYHRILQKNPIVTERDLYELTDDELLILERRFPGLTRRGDIMERLNQVKIEDTPRYYRHDEL